MNSILIWFRLAMLGIFMISLGLRFWNLGQFNTLVFDEVYFAKYANNYLIRNPFFDSHPPLSGYLIAIGIWIGSHIPTSAEITNNLTGSWRSTISYRWLNAFTGSFLPWIVGAIAYQLTHRLSYTLIIAFLALTDGLFLVESRYALNNIYLVSFGLLGQLFFLLCLNQNKLLYLTISGIFFGLSASIKWNGLGFLLGIYLIIILVILQNFLSYHIDYVDNLGVFEALKSIKKVLLIFNLVIVPIFTYSIIWLPYLLLNSQFGWWEVHQKMWSFHQSIGNTSDVHPYCSRWYTWLIMAKPIAYFYETKQTEIGETIYDVHAMGNPILWWLATASIFGILFLLTLNFFKSINQNNFSLFGFILINYLANLLPWIFVNRCTFLYHYMASYVFSWFGISWIIEQCLRSNIVFNRRLGILILLLISTAFIYWLPIYLGMPLSPQAFRIRMLGSWI